MLDETKRLVFVSTFAHNHRFELFEFEKHKELSAQNYLNSLVLMVLLGQLGFPDGGRCFEESVSYESFDLC